MKLNAQFHWMGDRDLTVVKQEGGEDVFAMSKRLHGERLIENTIQVVKILNAGRAALQEGKE